MGRARHHPSMSESHHRSQDPFVIVFAGAIGSSKTPITNYLSGIFALPIFNADAIRTEVTEDLLRPYDDALFRERRDTRLRSLIARRIDFILDASIDRTWKDLRPALERAGYRWFCISLDLGKPFLARLYEAKGYTESLQQLDRVHAEHERFLAEFGADVSLHLTEEDFPERLEKARMAVAGWISSRSG